jgi:predicted DNA-binding protein (UPF0251 family)
MSITKYVPNRNLEQALRDETESKTIAIETCNEAYALQAIELEQLKQENAALRVDISDMQELIDKLEGGVITQATKARERLEVCPDCGSPLRSYHGPGITRRVCSKRCMGYKVVQTLNHRDGQWFP